ncbi:MAG TPA: DNA mismatch repair protein MutS [Planctomycetota bacterium]|nr:DNA mismatch repair protein MutS [Planctomycetota bacterium]
MTATPMMQQFFAAKREHPDGLLFFRMGDFFELFGEDAVVASQLLGLTLTSRDKGANAMPMAGVPARAAEGYIHRLVRQGKKVVVCDQIQDPSEAKGIVDRAITRVVTPGTVLEEGGLQEKANNFLCGLFIMGDVIGIAAADLSTGAFLVEERPLLDALDAISALDIAECLLPESSRDKASAYASLTVAIEKPLSYLPDWRFDRTEAERQLLEHFKVARLEGFGVHGMGPAIGAAGAVLHYLKDTQRGALAHMTRLKRVSREHHLVLDRTTRASLELLKTQRDGERKGSLLWVLDQTLSPMGGRRLRQWVLEPLAQAEAIQMRQRAVVELHQDAELLAALRNALKGVQDMERLLVRVTCGRGSARELIGLRSSLEELPVIAKALHSADSELLRATVAEIPDFTDLVNLLQRALLDEVPATIKDGGMIRPGFDPDLDEIKDLGSRHRDWIARFQAGEAERTGIPSLKVSYNRVFGYYIEITHVHRDRIPSDYMRKQTLKNAERYITPELKEYEEKVLGAEERIKELEYTHFLALRDAVAERLTDIQRASEGIADLDALQSLAEAARGGRYVCPTIDDGLGMEIIEGRHPVLDRILKDSPLVPNDLRFEEGRREFTLITGPNMAGKSTYIRQAALLTIMAQMGAMIPADSARIGVVDRIFTRIGASDEISRGNSTFMVEMIETAEILNNATKRSLVILDEVGRGTSTHDGLAIAWAITEHLAQVIGCRTLFATHYHQLLDLVARLRNGSNLHVEVREWGEDIIFLHRLKEGGTDRSYGIHVARLAGLPPTVLARASEVLSGIEAEKTPEPSSPSPGGKKGEARLEQLLLFAEPEHPVLVALRRLNPDRMTPIDALLAMKEWKSLLT